MNKTQLAIFSVLILLVGACSNRKLPDETVKVVETNVNASGTKLEIDLTKGKYYNHPTFAIWVEDPEGNLIETLCVTQYLATGTYGHGPLGDGAWDNKPGPASRPATLPYWLHKAQTRDGKVVVPSPQHPLPDGITAATPAGNFNLATAMGGKAPSKIRVLMEINQPWDWNEYWNNSKYPDDLDYKTSCQPALVYAVTIDPSQKGKVYYMNPIGHSHYSGKDGELYTDLSTLTTAKEIVGKISVIIK